MRLAISSRPIAVFTLVVSLVPLTWVSSRAQTAPAADASAIHLVLTGDSIVNRRLSVYDDADSAGLFRIIQHADAAFTNFETLIHGYAYPAASESGGAYMSSPPWIATELKWAGFTLVSTANNHAYDFGEAGLLSTLRALDEAGLAHAGSGANLALARAPAYVETKRGRVALVAVASTFTAGSLASEQRPDLVGRPGVNPLRFTTSYVVDAETLQAAAKVAAAIGRRGGGGGGDQEEGAGGRGGGRGQARTSVRLGSLHLQAGDTPGTQTQLNPADRDGLVASVRNARRQADWVIVSSHTHESGAGGTAIPPSFLVDAAHAAIDAGADVVVSHGPHVLRGIEIYKGRPIFYSLGNFIFENETMAYQPAESYDSLGLPATATVADFFDARSANDTRGFPVQRGVWESAIADVSFRPDHTLQSIALVPISLGYREPRSQRGRPRLAPADVATRIVDTVTRLSASFGTQVVARDGRAVVVIGGEVPRAATESAR